MSRSPAESAKASEKDAYQQAWAAMQKLLRQGKSYSGRERNCCFLNLGGAADPSRARFATVSAATSLDFPDDSRGLATCDWDHDGRVDFWITNRTAPRVRLMLNRYESAGNGWTSLRLQGDGKSVNRDAIGARVEVYPRDVKTPLLRTVSAGNGFLSQSSVWQHVGLGTAPQIEKVIVRWPGAAAETFTGVEPGAHYDLRQGSGVAAEWTPPDQAMPPAISPPQDLSDDDTDAARLVLLAPLPLPESWLAGKPGKRGLLINLWSSECPHCRAELKDWGRRVKKWAASGVTLVSWCVDAKATPASRVAKSLGFTVPVLTTATSEDGGAPAELLAALNAVQQGCFGLQKDMPVPVSFLIDTSHRLVAIYKGPVRAAQVEADFELFGLRDAGRRMAASPDKSGKWYDPLGAVGVKGPMATLLEVGMREHAEALLLAGGDWYARPLPADATPVEQGWQRQELARIHHALAAWDLERDDFAAAEKRYLDSIASFPATAARRDLVRLYMSRKDRQLYPAMVAQLEAIVAVDPDPADMGRLGVLFLETGRPEDAVEPLRMSTSRQPDSMNFFQLGQALRATGQAAGAAEAWAKALDRKPDLIPALNNLAWLKATHRDAAVRDGKAAVQLAGKAVELTRGNQPVVLATMAAAMAESGDFPAAIATAETARVMAAAANDPVWPQRLEEWKARFTRGEAVRDD